ncbi:hypothetical protein L1887_24459 [Cichorium endivia]|nr:hypothetical protein L1887_24459 [Cichorium endivia]
MCSLRTESNRIVEEEVYGSCAQYEGSFGIELIADKAEFTDDQCVNVIVVNEGIDLPSEANVECLKLGLVDYDLKDGNQKDRRKRMKPGEKSWIHHVISKHPGAATFLFIDFFILLATATLIVVQAYQFGKLNCVDFVFGVNINSGVLNSNSSNVGHECRPDGVALNVDGSESSGIVGRSGIDEFKKVNNFTAMADSHLVNSMSFLNLGSKG